MIYKEHKDTRQQENAYICYMMLGSFFHKCSCGSPVAERQYLLYYKDMSSKEQEKREERLLKKLETFLGERLADLAASKCEMNFSRKGENICLRFDTGLEVILVQVLPGGFCGLRLYTREGKGGEYVLSSVA